LSVLRLSYWGFDDRPHLGTMIVNTAVAGDVVRIFGTLYRERFPIRRMQPEDVYGGSDPASMADDNTSGFNCRYAVATGPPHWSVHAYGEAIDVNTVENPYLFGTQVLPEAGRAYLDRSVYRPGMAVRGGLLVRAFAAVGWKWGGDTMSSPDYQHFSRTGG
jgi:D-alanyl-D-alanine carboxypeptidase